MTLEELSKVIELDKGRSFNAPIEQYYDGGTTYYDFVNILSEKNYNPNAASSSAGYITALNDGISTFKYVCGFNYKSSDTYYAPGVITSKVQKEYIIKVGDTSGGGNTPTEPIEEIFFLIVNVVLISHSFSSIMFIYVAFIPQWGMSAIIYLHRLTCSSLLLISSSSLLMA